MRLSKAWVIASKDLKIFRKKRSIMYAVILFPLVIAIGLPLIVKFTYFRSGGISPKDLRTILDAFSFFFIMAAATLPTTLASYSLVGEKVEKSLEPLLATPTSDEEILLGKGIASFFPPIIAIYISSIIFMILMDAMTYGTLGYFYFPNWSLGVLLLVMAPLVSIFSIELSIIISSKVSDIRAAQQLGGLLIFPFAGMYLLSELGIIPLTVTNLLVLSAIIFIVDAALFYASTSTFKREEILTRWK